jgi:copper chaperone CopZ
MELSEIDGVRSVVANEAEKTVRVEYEPPANPQAIETVLADINYPVAV